MTVKTTPFILFMTCVTLVAQVPPVVTNSGSTIDSATRDAMLRAAVRDFDAELTNSQAATNAVAPAPNTATAPTLPTPTPPAGPRPAPVAPAVPAATPPTQPVAVTPQTAPTNQTVTPFQTPIRTVPIPVVPAPTPAPTPTPAVVAQPTPAPIPTAAAVPAPAQTQPAAIPTTQPPSIGTIYTPSSSLPETVYSPGEIQFPQMDLNTFLDFYAKLVNRTVLRSAQLPQPTITLKTQTQLTRSEAIRAFDTVLAMNQIVMINVDEKFVKAVPANQAPIEAQPFVTAVSEKDLPESDQYISYVVQMKHLKPSEIITFLSPVAKMPPQNMIALDPSMMLIIRDFSANVKRMVELIRQVDIDVPLEYDSEVIPIRYAQAQEIASALGSLGAGTGTSIGNAGTVGRGGGAGGGLGAPSLGGFGGNTPGGGIGGRAGGLGNTGAYGAGGASTLGGASALGGARGAGGAGGSSFTDRLRGILGQGGGSGDFQILGRTKIIADLRMNSLLVFAAKQDMEMIKKIVDQLDRVLAQVLIDTIIMEVSLDETRNIGFSYLQNNPSQIGSYYKGIGGLNNGTFLNAQNFATSGTNGPNIPGGFSYAANFGNDFQATVTAIATDSRVNVLSRPSIQTSHAVTASLRIGDTVPYVTGTYFGGINGTASSQYQQTFVGIDLEVTPLINPDGLVVMDIYQDVQQLGTPTTIDGNAVPTTTQRTAKATVSVRDRDTIILGGFIGNSKTKSNSGMPFLKDLPGLGYLFRSSSDGVKRVELVVLIRPTVLPTPADASAAAIAQRNKLPLAVSAETDFRKEENRQINKAEKAKASSDRK